MVAQIGAICSKSTEVMEPVPGVDRVPWLLEDEGEYTGKGGTPGGGPEGPMTGKTHPETSPGLGQSGAGADSACADVLVVDDDEDVRSSMAAVLRSAGYSVTEASDGRSALDLLAVTKVGVLVLDLHMSPHDGVWLLERLADPPTVLIVSAFALYDEAAIRNQFSHVVSGYLRKPVAPVRLIEAIGQALGSR